MKLKFNMPAKALPVLAKQLRSFGARVEFETPTSGVVHSIAGMLEFEHHPDVLTVWVREDHGHFSPRLLRGGMRQMVEEAVEIAERTRKR